MGFRIKGVCASIVLYRSDPSKLEKTLRHLRLSLETARERIGLHRTLLVVVDNTSPPFPQGSLGDMLAACGWDDARDVHEVELIRNHGNIGFGAAHNLAIQRHRLPFHLVLNPDVYLPADAVRLAWDYCVRHPEVVLLSPAVLNPDGGRQHLLRPLPNLCDVSLRFLAMTFPSIRRWKRYARYECRHLDAEREHRQIPSLSGCFMWCRSEVLRSVGGFDPRFFLYYEDYDLSRRMAKAGETAYCPSIRVVHDWERLILRNWRLRYHNLRSAIRYFNKWGWKWC